MPCRPHQQAAIILISCVFHISAAVLYVDLNSTNPMPPFANWPTAATNIQDAVDASKAGDQVLVTNGVYQGGGRVVDGSMTNRLAVAKAITVLSVNGPAVTVIKGYQMPTVVNGSNAVRCVLLTNNASLIGFTVTNGATQTDSYPPTFGNQAGGGVWCASTMEVVSNCVICGNAAYGYGGAVQGGTLNNCILTNNTGSWDGVASCGVLNNCVLAGNSGYGAAYNSTLNNCTITANRSSYNGGGAGSCTLNNCTLTGNSAGGSGGGAISSTLNHCILTDNWAGNGGGAYISKLTNCTLIGNSAVSGGGTYGGTLNNCLLTGNSVFGSFPTRGDGGGTYGSTLNNCTVVSNSASGFAFGGGTSGGTLINCIIYYNTNSAYMFSSSNNYYLAGMKYCCTFPQPSGPGNFTNAPLFVDPAGGDFHLQNNSPCINAGNNSYVTITTDLDNHPRIKRGTVDMGAYEFQNPTSNISYAWLQQYGLPTDGTADSIDSDADGMNNWLEWVAGTDPTNSLSVLKMLAPSNSSAGMVVSWQSVANKTYYLQRSTNLLLHPDFSSIKSNIVGNALAASFTDTTATNPGPYFYRVGVQ